MRSRTRRSSLYLHSCAIVAVIVTLGWLSRQMPVTATVPGEATQRQTIEIQHLRLGQRVAAKRPDHGTHAEGAHDEGVGTPPQIDPAHWRRIDMTMSTPLGPAEIALLRPMAWIVEHQAQPHTTVSLDMPELELIGEATITRISACPEIEPGPGAVVTAKVRHPSDQVIHLEVEGEDEPLGTTRAHPIWSEDRQDYVAAGELHVGELLRDKEGQPRRLAAIHGTRGPPQDVYNLEVYHQHVYHVGCSGLLVHNCRTFKLGKHGDQPSPRPTGTQSHHGAMPAWMKKHFTGYDPDKAPAILMPTPNHQKTFGLYNTW